MNELALNVANNRISFTKFLLYIVVTLTFYAVIMNNLLTPRVFQMTDNDILSAVEGLSDKAFYLRQTVVALLLVTGYIALITNLKKKYSKYELLLITGISAITIPPLLSFLGATTHRLTPEMFMIPICFVSLLLLEYKDLPWFIRQARLISMVYIYGSILYAIIFPNNAIDLAYESNQGLWGFRFHGFATHANQLAPMAFLFIIINRLYEKKTKLDLLHYVAASATIVFTQSKTTWAAILIISLVALLVKMHPLLRRATFFFIAAPSIITFIAIAMNTRLQELIFGDRAKSLFTLTGRNLVWDYTIELWKSSPLFGYGLSLWKDETRITFLQLNNWAPAQSHGQFFQTLGQTGLIGVFGLLFYFGCLVFLGVKFRHKSRFVIISLVGLMLIRGVSESSLGGALFTENNIISFITFGLVVLYSKQKSVDESV